MRFLTLLVAVFISVAACAQNEPTTQPTMDPKMEAWMKASTPGEEHKMLQRYVGNWTHTAKMWMKPDSEPEVSTGSSEIKSIFDGRFIKHKVSGTSMGKPFEGMGITGYDNVQKNFTSFWIDNMGTGSMIGKGHFDKSQNAIIDRGTFSCPMTDTGIMAYRVIWTLPENDSFKYEMYAPGEDGKEYKMMEITYKRS